jgi:hypothetical protein
LARDLVRGESPGGDSVTGIEVSTWDDVDWKILAGRVMVTSEAKATLEDVTAVKV